MRLSQMSTDEVLDALCEITPYAERILKDETIIGTIGTAVDTSGMTKIGMVMAGVERIGSLVPLLLATHREDIYHILAAVDRVDSAEIAKQKLTVTLTQIHEMLHDEELLSFFKSSGGLGQGRPSAPSAPPPASGQEAVSPSSQP